MFRSSGVFEEAMLIKSQVHSKSFPATGPFRLAGDDCRFRTSTSIGPKCLSWEDMVIHDLLGVGRSSSWAELQIDPKWMVKI